MHLMTKCYDQMLDYDNMVKALRLSWLKRIVDPAYSGFWKSYLDYLLQNKGGLFLIQYNYDINLTTISGTFYRELLKWWSNMANNFIQSAVVIVDAYLVSGRQCRRIFYSNPIWRTALGKDLRKAIFDSWTLSLVIFWSWRRRKESRIVEKDFMR